MRKIILMLLCGIALCGISSCTSDEPVVPDSPSEILSRSDNDDAADKLNYKFSPIPEPDAPMLEFENQKDYDFLLDMISEVPTREEKKALVEEAFPGFVSMQDRYSELIDRLETAKFASELDSLCNRTKEIKTETELQRHLQALSGAFFFPLIDGDAGPYLMTSDSDKAYLCNINGDVKIAGEVVNCLDLRSYDELSDLGKTWNIQVGIEPLSVPTGATWFDCKKGKKIEKPISSPNHMFSLNKSTYKARVDVCRQITKKWKMQSHYEVTFRKYMGKFIKEIWINTKLQSVFNVIETDTYGRYSKTTTESLRHKKGSSSHNFETACMVLHDGGTPMAKWNRILPNKTCYINVTFIGDKHQKTESYELSLPARYNDRDESGRLTPWTRF